MKRIWYSDVYNIVPCILNPYLSFHIDSSGGVWQFCVFLQQLAVARWDEAKVAQGSARQPRSLSITWHFGRADSHAQLCRVAVSLATSLLQLSFATSAAHEKNVWGQDRCSATNDSLTTMCPCLFDAEAIRLPDFSGVSRLHWTSCESLRGFACCPQFLPCQTFDIPGLCFWRGMKKARVPENSWVP